MRRRGAEMRRAYCKRTRHVIEWIGEIFPREVKMKKTFYSELAYIIGIISLPLGAALLRKADFGMSMVVAPAFILADRFDFLSPGVAAYTFQALLLVLFCIVMRRCRAKYFISFVTAFIYGNILNFWLWLLSFGDPFTAALTGPYLTVFRVALMILGILFTAFGVAVIMKSYIPPEVYDLIVQGVSEKFGFKVGKVKWIYDAASLALSVALSFILFGALRDIGIGTVISAAVNGPIIAAISKLLDNHFDFKPGLKAPGWLL